MAACGGANNGSSSSTPLSVAPALAAPGTELPQSLRQTGVHAVRPTGITHVRIHEFALPNGNSEPLAIAAGPDGSVWFTELLGNRIGRITYHGVITEFALPRSASHPVFIVAGPEGNMWFTEGAGRIGRITNEFGTDPFRAT